MLGKTHTYSLAHLKSDININQLSKAKQKQAITRETKHVHVHNIHTSNTHIYIHLFGFCSMRFIRLQAERLQTIMAPNKMNSKTSTMAVHAFNLENPENVANILHNLKILCAHLTVIFVSAWPEGKLFWGEPKD